MDIRAGVDSGFPTKASANGGWDEEEPPASRPLLIIRVGQGIVGYRLVAHSW